MLILKSGMIFLKNDDNILISPYSNKTKKITSERIEEIWDEMRYIFENNNYSNLEMVNLLRNNKLLFELSNSDYSKYNKYSRNVQSLSNLKDDPFNMYQNIISSKVLIIGVGTVGSSLIHILSKYGVENISIVDGDKVSLKNLTSQTLYEDKDIGLSKVNVLSSKIDNINNYYNIYLNKNNIDEIIREISPDYVFCCADDQSLELQNLLIDKIKNYKYKLFISGYSYSKIIVNYIKQQDIDIFKKMYKKKIDLNKENILFHNTGTIVDGFLSSAFIMNTFVNSFFDEENNQFVFDKELFNGYKKKIKKMNDMDSFNEYYNHSINYLKDNSNITARNEMLKYEEDKYYQSEIKYDTTNIQEFYNLLTSYNNQKGSFNEQYRKAIMNHVDINLIRKNIKDDVKLIFADKYISLINDRKNMITKNISKIFIDKYRVNVLDIILKYLESNSKKIYVSPEKILDNSINKNYIKIDYYEAIAIILKNTDSENFRFTIINMIENGLIDYKFRKNKTNTNMTIFNPVKKISNIIINYEENINGLMTLSHELSHAFIFEKFKHRLSYNNFKNIDKEFWEILANVGEMYILDNCSKLNNFLFLTQYNFNFCLLDYLISKECKDIDSFDEIIKIKHKLTELLGIDKESLYYIDYNFILFPALYSENINIYTIVYQDLLSIALFNHIKNLKLTFEDFINDILKLEELNVDSLLDNYKLDVKDSALIYIEEMLKSLHKAIQS